MVEILEQPISFDNDHEKGERSRVLTVAEIEHTELLLSMFSKHMLGTLSSQKNSVEIAIGAIRIFYTYVGLPPWEWEEFDLADFIAYKVQHDKIGLHRQSTYFTYLRSFQNFILNQRGLSNEIHRKFGVQPQRYVTDESSIPIKRKRFERKTRIRPLSKEECELIKKQFGDEIDQAKLTGSKSYQPLRRDKTMTMLSLLSGVRVDELVHLSLDSFMGDVGYPNFGNYALLTVLGKGRKQRVIRFYNPIIRELMDWYIDDVRPCFLRKDMPDINLLFISQKSGGVIDTDQLNRRLKSIASHAGLSVRITPHILRHTYGTEMKGVIGPEALQEQLGHENLSTTLGTYYHPDPVKTGNGIRRSIEKMTRSIEAMTGGIDNESNTNK